MDRSLVQVTPAKVDAATASSAMAPQVEAIARRHHLTRTFRSRVLRETGGWVATPGIDDRRLDDLRHLPFVTIDNVGSRDLDQALHLCRSDDGTLVRYAVADASYYVRPGSALFAEALRRGATYYLPGLNLTMLPRPLCEGVISLNCGVDRRAVVFSMSLDRTGHCVHTSVSRARIHSRAKLSFARVQRFFDEPFGSELASAPFAESLELLREVGRLRADAARDRDVVQYHRRELELKADGSARSGFTFTTRDRLEVERHNEQISLLCNVEGARILQANQRLEWVQAVFRVHPPPASSRRIDLAEQLSALRRLRHLDPAVWQWRIADGQTLAAFLRALPSTGPLSGLTRAVERQALLSNQRSLFAVEAGGHFGVGAPVYARVSAPMREIVGVFTHKELLESLGDGRDTPPSSCDLVLRERVVVAGNRAKAMQTRLDKEVQALVLDDLFTSDLAFATNDRRWHSGTVLGMKSSHVYVELDELPVEVKLYRDYLQQSFGTELTVDHHQVAVLPTAGGAPVLCLGDRVRLRVLNHDAARDRWRFELSTD